jgi:hypothetical protein
MIQNLIPTKKTCPACQGHGYLETGQTFTLLGRIHPELVECSACEKRGYLIEWIDIHQLSMMFQAVAAELEAEYCVSYYQKQATLSWVACFISKKGVSNGY